MKDIKNWLIIGAVAGGVYLAYKLFGGAAQVANTANNAINQGASALANWYVKLTSSGAAIPTGMIILPNGAAVPVSQLQVSPVPGGGNSAMFNYGGATYYLNSPHDANGNWEASTAPIGGGAYTCCASTCAALGL
jgi:hypothetical protein